MQALVFIVLLLGTVLSLAAFSIAGNLHRIATAVEAQNKHYGIGRQSPVTIVNRDEARSDG